MPVLPLIDALIALGWTSIFCAMALKSVYLTTSIRWAPFGMHPSDFLSVAGLCMLFALALAARTWVKANEGELLARRRRARFAEAGYTDAELDAIARPRADEEPARRVSGY